MKPKAVIISDVHYSIHTLKLASASILQAIRKSNELNIPLIVAGDLHDTKANMRAECVNEMIKVFSSSRLPVFLLRGNHDQINEKSEEHALNFLSPYVNIVDFPRNILGLGWLIPYQHDLGFLKEFIAENIQMGDTVIMHQGIEGSHAGDYFQDKTALRPEDIANPKTVVSGHYHRRQVIKLPYGGEWHYVGNPYTLNFGEANDPEKGFRVLMEDGTLEFIPTRLRKHVVIDCTVEELTQGHYGEEDEDLLWIKVRGSSDELATVTKERVATRLAIVQDFRLDLIAIDTKAQEVETKDSTHPEILDKLIDSLDTVDDNRKTRLKGLWKGLHETNKGNS